jgi:TP901 family phage tail tape measure protein
MATVGTLMININANTAGLDAGLNSAQTKLRNAGQAMQSVGKSMTLGITAPLMGVAAMANRAGTALNREMANVQSLGVAIERTNELKSAVQDLAIETGKDTTDMAQGLYQVISAFGDSADTVEILGINAKLAAGGLAQVDEAIALTSAVTKAYGDTSAKAVQKVSDLSLKTVQLGQTTLPELAKALPRVTALAAELGVQWDELFATFATATGVTGSASEVATQMRGILQALMAPSTQMRKLYKDLNVESGQALLDAQGFGGALEAIVGHAKAAGEPLQAYIGSIEGQTLALALAGPQAETFAEKLAAMGDAAGTTNQAFTAQTQGINKAGFAAQQAAVKWEVFLQKINDALGPLKLVVMDALEPLADKALALANAFADLDPKLQLWITGAAAAAAAAGPLLIAMGSLATAAAAISLPGLLAAAAIVAIGAAAYLYKDELAQFATNLSTAVGYIADMAQGNFVDAAAKWQEIPEYMQPATAALGKLAAALGRLATLVNNLSQASSIQDVFDALNIPEGWQDKMESALEKLEQFVRLYEKLKELMGGGGKFYDDPDDPGRLVGGGVVQQIETSISTTKNKINELVTELQGAFESGGWEGLYALARSKVAGLADALLAGVADMQQTIMLGIAMAGVALQMQVNRALAAAGTFLDESGVRAWVDRTVAQARQWIVDQFAEGTEIRDFLDRQLGRIAGIMAIAQSVMSGFEEGTAVENFNALLAGILEIYGALRGIQTDAILTAAAALSRVTTAVLNFGTAVVKGWNAEAIAKALGGTAKNLADGLKTAIEGADMEGMGAAAGAFASTLVTKLGEVLGAPEFGENVGGALGKAATAIAEGAQSFAKSFAAEVGKTDWSQFGMNLYTFVEGFINELYNQTVNLALTKIKEQAELDLASWWEGFQSKDTGAQVEELMWMGKGDFGQEIGDRVAAGIMASLKDAFPEPQWLASAKEKLTIEMPDLTDLKGTFVYGAAGVKQALAEAMKWPDLPEAFTGWKWPVSGGGLSELLDWKWPGKGNGLSELIAWKWPQKSGGLSELLNWKWPTDFQMPGWVASLLGVLGGISSGGGKAQGGQGMLNDTGQGGGTISLFPPKYAGGTRLFPGGWSLVGELGPELVRLPRGTDIFSNSQSRRMLEPESVTVNVYVDNVNSELDMESLAWRVARHVQRRG